MRNGMGMGMGAGGGKPGFVNPAIPAVDNIVRCWSLRRNVPSYKKGAGIRELRASGGSENDVLFNNAGKLSITGADAFANVIYDQKGNADSKLLQGTFTACPKVFESSAMFNGLYFDGGDRLSMASADATIRNAIVAGLYSVSYWFYQADADKAGEKAIVHRWATDTDGGAMICGVNGGKVISYQRSNAPLTTNGIFVDGWHMVTISFNKAANAHIIRVFSRAGVLLETKSSTAGNPITSTVRLFSIGANEAGQLLYKGYANDICFWDIALTEQQSIDLNAATRLYYPA